MKRKWKRSVAAALALCMAATLAACGNAPTLQEPLESESTPSGETTGQTYSFTVGTSASGGAVYGVGAGLSQLLNEKVPGLELRAIATGGAVDNVALMSRDEIQLACNASAVNGMAYAGEQEGLDAQTNLRGICSLYPSVFHFVATKSSGITSLEDLKGTKGAVGQSASATDVYTQHVLGMLGIDYKDRQDITPVYCDPAAAAEQMKDGHIEWGHMPLGIPGSAVTDLALSSDIVLLPIEGEFRDELIEKYPYYVPYTIPAGTYNGIDEDVETVACVITLVADESVDEEIVYQMTKAIWENLDEVKQISGSMSWMDPADPAAGIGVPLHPGAQRYYEEAGMLTEEQAAQ